jgi:hypothetical protein
MKRALMFVLMITATLAAAEDRSQPSASSDVIHVATALDHISVLEFGEPVTMAAAGSPAFQIERHEDKVFIKPLKPGISTNLFVWTASRRFNYEIEPPGEVRNMSFAIDNTVPKSAPTPNPEEQMSRIADSMLSWAFLNVEQIDSSAIKDHTGDIQVQVESVLESSNTLYIHYSIRNLSGRDYRVVDPTVSRLLPVRSSVSLAALERTQLDKKMERKLGKSKQLSLQPAKAQARKLDLAPNEETSGVIAIRGQFPESSVFQITFPNAGEHHVAAVFVR